METIQVTLDARLVRAIGRAARRSNLSRSALIRNALSVHLRTLDIRRLEEQDRKGYQWRPQESEKLLGTRSSLANWIVDNNVARSVGPLPGV
jgi:metal-responsive CopG/Arc/MetJ family transcriptional regulator